MIALRALAATLATCGALAAAEDRPTRPNILMIFVDDVGHGDVGFNGRKSWQTPNLDRLAAQGQVFRRFYAGGAVCAPSRAVLLSGRSTIHNGVTRNADDLPGEERTIAEALHDLGYDTACFGKWHRGMPRGGSGEWVHPLDQGFDEFFGFADAVHAFEKFPSELWDGRAKVPVSGYADDLFAGRAVEFLRRPRDPDRPFFLYLPLISGHFRIQAPEDEIDRHRGKFEELNPDHPINATYAAMMTRMDRNIGQVLDALEAAGLADDTLVVFASDHGATFEMSNGGASAYHDSNAPFRGQKRTLWEGGLRVPACARWPGRIAAGSSSDVPMHAADLFPTFLAAAQAPGEASDPDLHPPLEGVDLLPLWTSADPPPAPERTLFWEWRSEGADLQAAMRGDFKLVVDGGKAELYNVMDDPTERRDLAPSNPLLVRSLRRELRAWLDTETRRLPQAPVASRRPLFRGVARRPRSR